MGLAIRLDSKIWKLQQVNWLKAVVLRFHFLTRPATEDVSLSWPFFGYIAVHRRSWPAQEQALTKSENEGRPLHGPPNYGPVDVAPAKGPL